MAQQYDPLSSNNFRNWIHELFVAVGQTPRNDTYPFRTPTPVPNSNTLPSPCSNSSYLPKTPIVHTNQLLSTPILNTNQLISAQLPTNSWQTPEIRSYPDVLCDTNNRQPCSEFSGPVSSARLVKPAAIPPYAYPIPMTRNDARTGKKSLVHTLLAWCPIEIQPDGDCCVAGIYKESSQKPFKYIKTAIIQSVAEEGRLVKTVDGHAYRLSKGISWWIHTSNSLKSDLPDHLHSAFADGFPIDEWRSWTRGLYYFISSSCSLDLDRKSSHGSVIQRNRPDGKLVSSDNVRKYKQIISTYTPLVEYDENTAPVPMEEDKSDTGTFENPTSPELSNASSSSFDYSEVVIPVQFGRKSTDHSHNKSTQQKPDKRSSPHLVVSPRHSHQTSRPKTTTTTTKTPIDNRKRHSVTPSKVSRPKSQTANKLPSRDHSSVARRSSESQWRGERDRNAEIPKKYRLYTASGSLVDSRDLDQTRSGRWIIPKLSKHHNQVLRCRKNGLLEVFPE